MAALSEFHKLVRIFVPGAPEPTIDYAVVRAARRFCSLSWWARRTITITYIADQVEYDLAPSDTTNEEIIGVKAIEHNEFPLDPTKPELVLTATGIPKQWYYEPNDVVILNPYPDTGVAGDTALVRIAIQPTLEAELIADDIYREWSQCIADGAVSWLQSVPKQPWSDPQASQMMEAKFIAQCMRAKEAAIRGQIPWGINVRRPVFAVR